MKNFIRSLVSERVVLLYHWFIAIAANLWHRFPSRRLVVIGVTGTNGKTTVCNLIAHLLSAAGYSTGLATTINFKIGDRVWVNRTKQGMQGRFRLQRLLRDMVREGCTHAVIETTSEGIKQYRHWGIRYTAAVFTNLTPEHIESHGSFEKYREAKGKLFASLRGRGVSVVNGDDASAEYFLKFPAKEKLVYQVQAVQELSLRGAERRSNLLFKPKIDCFATLPMTKNEFSDSLQTTSWQSYGSELKILRVTEYRLSEHGSEFEAEYDGKKYVFTTRLLGLFNIYNCAAAVSAALALNAPISVLQGAVASFPPVSGRMEIIRDPRRDITVVVDYAHDPAALKNVYETIQEATPLEEIKNRRIIAVLGAVGGGRDKAKRPLLGALAAQYAQYVIITNEDPYYDDPEEIMNEVEAGVTKDPSWVVNVNYWKILDRRAAIKKAVALARAGDVIALTGKGCEEVMAVKGGFVPWDDRKVAREELAA